MEVIPLDKMKDYLIAETTIRTLQPENVVDKVINFEFKEARDALKLFGEVEISGFGKFIVSQAKLRRKLIMQVTIENAYIKKIERNLEILSDKKRDELTARLEKTRETIEYLKTKLV